MKVSGCLHAPAVLLPVPTEYEAGWSPEPALAVWRTGKFLGACRKFWSKNNKSSSLNVFRLKCVYLIFPLVMRGTEYFVLLQMSVVLTEY